MSSSASSLFLFSNLVCPRRPAPAQIPPRPEPHALQFRAKAPCQTEFYSTRLPPRPKVFSHTLVLNFPPAHRRLFRAPIRLRSARRNALPHILLSLTFVVFRQQFRSSISATKSWQRSLSAPTRSQLPARSITPLQAAAHPTPSQPSVRLKIPSRHKNQLFSVELFLISRPLFTAHGAISQLKNICRNQLFSSAFSCATITPVHKKYFAVRSTALNTTTTRI